MNKPSLIVGFPLYKSVPATFFTRWLSMDKAMVEATVVTDGVYVTQAMSRLVSMALEHGDRPWDRLVIMEHDMIPPLDAFNRIASYSSKYHVVGPVCFQHVPPYVPMVFGSKPDDPDDVLPFGADIMKQLVETPALYACSAVSLGFTSIHRDVLTNWDSKIPMFVHDNETSHDVYFSEQARKQGFDVFVDSTLVCDHLSEMPIGYLHNQQWAAFMTGMEQQNEN
jgi:hypothetical protein